MSLFIFPTLLTSEYWRFYCGFKITIESSFFSFISYYDEQDDIVRFGNHVDKSCLMWLA